MASIPTDLREKINKSRSKRVDTDSEQDPELIYSGDSKDNSSEAIDSSETDVELLDETDGDIQSDRNNNAQKIKSVVVETTTRKGKTRDKVQQKITVNHDNRTDDQEEGEISSSDTGNWDSFVEQADDDQFAAFLERHRARIDRLTGKTKDKTKAIGKEANSRSQHIEEGSGEDNQLAVNIRRLSIMDKQGK